MKAFSHRKLGPQRNWSENCTPSTHIYCSTSSYLHDGTERGFVSAVDSTQVYAFIGEVVRGKDVGQRSRKNTRTGRRKTQILVRL